MKVKRLIKMAKSHSPHEVIFTVDVDTHFMNVEVKKRATGEVKSRHYILSSDVEQWIGLYQRNGFEILSTNK